MGRQVPSQYTQPRLAACTAAAFLAAGVGWMWWESRAEAAGAQISVAGLARVGTVDARFQSYNVEMVEVTGGP